MAKVGFVVAILRANDSIKCEFQIINRYQFGRECHLLGDARPNERECNFPDDHFQNWIQKRVNHITCQQWTLPNLGVLPKRSVRRPISLEAAMSLAADTAATTTSPVKFAHGVFADRTCYASA